DLLAYLVRRLLENGANSSFVNQIVDTAIAPETIAADPIDAVAALGDAVANPRIVRGPELFLPRRANSRGFDLAYPVHLAHIESAREPWSRHEFRAGPIIAARVVGGAEAVISNPGPEDDVVGRVTWPGGEVVEAALAAAGRGVGAWSALAARERAAVLNRVADLYEANCGELFAIASREAGKILLDCVGEVREAVDFLRYYAAEAVRLETPGEAGAARGVFACISPGNFPL